MRELILLLSILATAPLALTSPHLGVLVWSWLSFGEPQTQAYVPLPLVFVVSIVTAIGMLVSSEPKSLSKNPFPWLIVAFMILMTVTTILSQTPEKSWPFWNPRMKTMLLVLAIAVTINNRVRIHALVWMIVLGMGYYSLRGGLYIMMGGGGQILTFIGDDNISAAYMVTMWPLMYYLRLHSAEKFIQIGLLAMMVISVFGILGTTSRGGLIALCCMLSYFWWKSRHKVVIAVCGMIGIVVALQVMPQKWMDKMNTIHDYNQVGSLQERTQSWQVAIKMAIDHPLIGGGMESITSRPLTEQYDPDRMPLEAHSIWFQMLSDHGFTGLALFIAIIVVSWRNAAYVRRFARSRPELLWAGDLATMGQLSMVGYMVAGSALSIAYYDAFYAILAMLAVMRVSVAKWAIVPSQSQSVDAPLMARAVVGDPVIPMR